MELLTVILEGEDARPVVDVGAPLVVPTNDAPYGLYCLVKQILRGGKVEENQNSSPLHPSDEDERTTDPQ